MSEESQNLHDHMTWPDLAIALYEKLTGKGAAITYEFENLEVHVPSSTHENAKRAHWTVNGKLRITTSNPNG